MLISKETGEIRLDNTDHHLIFTAEAFTWIESALKCGTLDVIGRAASLSMSMTDVQVCIWAGMEAWRRRNGNQGKPINPSKALKQVEATGGLVLAMGQLAEAFEHAPSLGLRKAVADEEAAEEDDTDPTIGGESSDDSSPPVFQPNTPGD